MKRTFAIFSFVLALAVTASGTLMLTRSGYNSQRGNIENGNPSVDGINPCPGVVTDTPCVEAQGKDSGIRALSNGIVGGGFLQNCASRALQAVASTLSSDRNQ